MKNVKFYTLGCKVNAYETGAMRALFEKSGYIAVDSGKADVYVINTCTVTATGDQKSRQMIHRARRENPHAIVAVVGCYAQSSTDEVRAIDGVDIVLGTADRSKIVDYVNSFCGDRIDAVHETIEARYEELTSAAQSRTRAALKIQDGCDSFCAYCIIPYARGPARSRAMDSLIDEARTLAGAGYTEMVLTGINLSLYGIDTGHTLADAVQAVCGVEGVKRVRLSSLEPLTMTDEFINAVKPLKNLCPSFHLSMQSGCEKTLWRMNRKYTPKRYLELTEALRAAFPGCAITTDVMVGFPGETDEEFAESIKTAEKARFADMHVFRYSRRKGTVAANMPNQVPSGVSEARSKQMIKLGKQMKREFCEGYIGKTTEVLFETETEGFTDTYVRVRVPAAKGIENSYQTVKITAYDGDVCIASLKIT